MQKAFKSCLMSYSAAINPFLSLILTYCWSSFYFLIGPRTTAELLPYICCWDEHWLRKLAGQVEDSIFLTIFGIIYHLTISTKGRPHLQVSKWIHSHIFPNYGNELVKKHSSLSITVHFLNN